MVHVNAHTTHTQWDPWHTCPCARRCSAWSTRPADMQPHGAHLQQGSPSKRPLNNTKEAESHTQPCEWRPAGQRRGRAARNARPAWAGRSLMRGQRAPAAAPPPARRACRGSGDAACHTCTCTGSVPTSADKSSSCCCSVLVRLSALDCPRHKTAQLPRAAGASEQKHPRCELHQCWHCRGRDACSAMRACAGVRAATSGASS